MYVKWHERRIFRFSLTAHLAMRRLGSFRKLITRCHSATHITMSDRLESLESNQSTSSSSASAWTDDLFGDNTKKTSSPKTADKNAGAQLTDFVITDVQSSNVVGGDTKPVGEAKPTPVGDANPTGHSVGDGPSKPPEAADTTKDSKGVAIIPPTERGEVIFRDVEPGVASGGKGDSLKAVAKDRLGPGATQEQVEAYVKELARVNHIKDVNKPLDGSTIVLPGHTKDGGFVTLDADHNKRTIWHDGSVKVENTDRTGYVRHPNADGSLTIHTWGPNKDQNADLIKTPDGKYRIADGPNDKVGHEPATPNEKLIAERQRIADAADMKIANPEERARFHKDMHDFEDRIKQRAAEEKKRADDDLQKNLITPERATELKAEAEANALKQMSETYKHTSRILEASDNPKVPLKEKDRTAIAEQIIHQAANPTSVDQGYHNTCNVTTIESKLYTIEPSRVAETVADVATTGKHRIAGPPPADVEIDPGSIKPDKEARNNPPKDGQRSHASQIFEVTAVNAHYERINQASTPPGKIRYEQHEAGKVPDTGERLMDYSKNPPKRIQSKQDDGKLIDSPDLTSDDLYWLEQQFRSGSPENRYLSNDPSDHHSTQIKSEQELNDELARLKKLGMLPVTISVHTDNYPFHSDGGEAAGGKGDWHVVTITDYHPGPPPKAEMDNQWGSKSDKLDDKSLTVKDLFNAMRDPKDADHIKALQDQIAQDKRDGKPVDMLKETELLRLKRRANMISDQEVVDEVTRIFMENARLWNKKLDLGPPTDEDVQTYQTAMNDTRDLRATLPKDKQKELNEGIMKKLKAEGIVLHRKRN